MTTTTLTPELLDRLLADYEKPEDLTGDDELFRRLKKALIERALGAELTDHRGYERGDPADRGSGNSRNGVSAKTVLTDDGEVQIEVPRDRAGTFEPQLIGKGQTRFDDFDDKIISLYARGMTVREIQGYLAELYGTEVSPDLISKVTERCWTKSGIGRTGRSTRSIPWVSSMPCGSKSVTRERSRTRRSMSRWASIRQARGMFWASGSSRSKVPNSGSRS
jgi:Transposase, Mutator family